MARTDIIVVVGAGHAGGRAVSALRAAGCTNPIVMIGAEPYAPYERPPLSKDVLAGRAELGASEIYPRSFYEDSRIDLRLNTTAARIATRAQRVWLDDGTSLPYDKLLLCTGARPRRLNVPGAKGERILYLRTRDDAKNLRERLHGAASLAVIGGGLIGLEVAATARKQGCKVCVFETAPALLSRLGLPALSEAVRQLHEREGVELRMESSVRAFDRSSSNVSILLDDGSRSSFDLVIVGIGVVPETELAEKAGIRCADGIIVNESCETSIPGIFAAGDVACRIDSIGGFHERLETWQNAEEQAAAAASAMAGRREPYRPIPYIWTNQFDVQIQFAGRAEGADVTLTRGEFQSGKAMNFYLRKDTIVAVLGVNASKEFGLARRLIGADTAGIDHAILSDDRTSLKPVVTEYLRTL